MTVPPDSDDAMNAASADRARTVRRRSRRQEPRPDPLIHLAKCKKKIALATCDYPFHVEPLTTRDVCDARSRQSRDRWRAEPERTKKINASSVRSGCSCLSLRPQAVDPVADRPACRCSRCTRTVSSRAISLGSAVRGRDRTTMTVAPGCRAARNDDAITDAHSSIAANRSSSRLCRRALKARREGNGMSAIVEER